MKKEKYPRLKKYGIKVYKGPLDYVLWMDVRKVLDEQNNMDRFTNMFGIQTQLTKGPYAHDVESVFERLASGRLTGTQLLPD